MYNNVLNYNLENTCQTKYYQIHFCNFNYKLEPKAFRYIDI
jgi:hypothetical protein